MKYRKFKNIFLIGSPWHAIIIRNFYQKGDGIIIEYTSQNSLRSITNNLNKTHKIIYQINSKNFFLSNIILNNPFKLISLKKILQNW